MSINKRFLIIHNLPAPYRVSQFDLMSKHLPIDIFYGFKKKGSRKWSNKTGSCPSFFISGPVFFGSKISLGIKSNQLKKYKAALFFDSGFDMFFVNFFTFIKCLIFKIPIVFVVTQIDTNWLNIKKNNLFYLIKAFIVKIYRKIFYSLSKHIIANSKMSRNYLLAYNVPIKKITIAPVSIDINPFLKLNKKKGNDIDILFLSYVRDSKGLELLINVFMSIRQKNIRLHIVGDGDKLSYYKFLAKKDIRIIFHGHSSDEKKLNFFSKAAFFVLPTEHDPWGLVINEAMASGLPVIVTDSAGSSEMVRANGFVIKPNSFTELKSAIEILIKNKEQRLSMGLESRKIISKYSLKNTVDKYINVLMKVVS